MDGFANIFFLEQKWRPGPPCQRSWLSFWGGERGAKNREIRGQKRAAILASDHDAMGSFEFGVSQREMILVILTFVCDSLGQRR